MDDLDAATAWDDAHDEEEAERREADAELLRRYAREAIEPHPLETMSLFDRRFDP